MRSTLQRILLTAVAAVVLVVAAAAMASSAPGDDPGTATTTTNKREAVRDCREAHRANPDAAPSPECQAMRDQHQAKRDAVRECREAHRANPDAAPSPECQAMREQRKQGQQGRQGKQGDGGHKKGDLLGRVVHGDLIVEGKDGQFENVTLDRGKVASADGTTITLDRRDGKKVTLKINADTRFRGVESADAVRDGEPAVVVSKDGTAIVVAQRKPKPDAG